MALLWVGQTKNDARSTAAPAATATLAQVTVGVGHWEIVVSIGFGSAALGANDTATNWQLALAWTGTRAGSPTLFKLVAIPVINSMTPMLLLRDLEVLPDMAGAGAAPTLTIQNILAATTATYIAFLAATPFSL